MKLIAHRGNLYGPNPSQENKPEYIINTIKHNYDCEIDVHYINGEYFLGHDNPDYKINLDFLLSLSKHLWIHCKNFEAFDELIQIKELNIFWHQNDNYTLTSHQFIWAYPNMPVSNRCIILLPELNNFVFDNNGYAICTDFVDKIKQMLEPPSKNNCRII
jgi:hypothetical protein